MSENEPNNVTRDRALDLTRGEILRRAGYRTVLAEHLLEIGREIARLPKLDHRSAEEMLYDESGLPT